MTVTTLERTPASLGIEQQHELRVVRHSGRMVYRISGHRPRGAVAQFALVHAGICLHTTMRKEHGFPCSC